jgi:hypothetical protein
MKTKNIAIISIAVLLCSCIDKKQPINPPFKPALEQIITGLVDSLKDEIGETQLLSIQFFYREYNDPPGIKMRFFLSDWYASGSIEGYAKIDNTTIAIYNLRDDYCELVNKNAITFFTDTLVGFRDVGIWKTSERDIEIMQFYYLIHGEDSISRISDEKTFGSFPYPELIRKHKYTEEIIEISEEDILFLLDSLTLEEELKYYEKQVKYYRNKLNSTSP